MQLFPSFNSADRTSVIAVQRLLQARGITTFLDRDNLVPGPAWSQALEQALRAVDSVAGFIGCELGGWQKREMWFALHQQVRKEKACLRPEALNAFDSGCASPLAAARAAAGEHMGRCQLYTRPRPAFCYQIRTFQAYKGVNSASL
jgi:hypothetical protein